MNVNRAQTFMMGDKQAKLREKPVYRSTLCPNLDAQLSVVSCVVLLLRRAGALPMALLAPMVGMGPV